MAEGHARVVQGRWWLGTLYAFTNDHRTAEWLPANRVQAYAGQVERCPTSGREHLQFCVRFTKNVTFQTVKRLCGDGAHIELVRKPRDAWAYCQKEETRVDGPWVTGTPDLRSRKEERTLLRVSALAGKTFAEVCDELDCSIYQVAQVKRAYDLLTEPYTGPFETIEYVYGPSGAGKSHYVRDLATRLGQRIYWYIPQDGKFAAIAPYTGEGILVFNEFQDFYLSRAFMAWLKVFLDDGGFRHIDYKGASAPLVARHVVFIAQDVPPWDLRFIDDGARVAFLRRLSQFGKVIHARERTFTPVPLSTTPPYAAVEVCGAAGPDASSHAATGGGRRLEFC